MWGARRDKEIEGAVMGRSAGPGVLLGPGEATEVILDGIKYLARGCIIKDPCITVAIIFTTNNIAVTLILGIVSAPIVEGGKMTRTE